MYGGLAVIMAGIEMRILDENGMGNGNNEGHRMHCMDTTRVMWFVPRPGCGYQMASRTSVPCHNSPKNKHFSNFSIAIKPYALPFGS